ncbi:MAG: 3-hydroxyacyl-ACP dehydratase FabZ [Proteobacteria bacterium]|nr:3-hydroxyacyl-ACP dehydratase FabZ [Pseudomonadota bacterium]MBU1714149.1 3-hydroxyacyl-ACP dehydratase FabZ [Pseudomonadota bacterium]
MDIKEILEFLPHRYPFILVDRILDVEIGDNIVGLKNVTINEPFFVGHFPGEPVMPGVLIMEGMAQVGGTLAYLTAHEDFAGKLIYFAGLDGVRFRQKVIPGDQLIMKLKILKRKGKIFKMEGKAYVDDNLVAEAVLMASFG